MGISSDGQICYGIAFEEDYQFPWIDEQWDGDPEEWWFTGVCGYKPPFEVFNDQGEWADGVRPPQETMDEYYKHHREFQEAHPMPVEIVMYCSYDYPMYIVAALDTSLNASRGDAVRFKPYLPIGRDKIIIDFCEKYCKLEDGYCEFPKMEPGWLLSSMYG